MFGIIFIDTGYDPELKKRLKAKGHAFAEDVEGDLLQRSVRVRMLATMKESDGIQIVEYEKGKIYELPESLAALYLGSGWAEKIRNDGG